VKWRNPTVLRDSPHHVWSNARNPTDAHEEELKQDWGTGCVWGNFKQKLISIFQLSCQLDCIIMSDLFIRLFFTNSQDPYFPDSARVLFMLINEYCFQKLACDLFVLWFQWNHENPKLKCVWASAKARGL